MAVVITAQPDSQTVLEGQIATFGVSATGVGTLSYQWKSNSVPVGTDSPLYNTAPTVPGGNGASVTVDVTDDEDTVVSDAAILTVVVPPLYPEGFPCPTWSYSQNVTRFQRRTPFDSGWTRQRLQWEEKGASISLEYKMDTYVFSQWATWAQQYGYTWFQAELDSFGGSRITATIRFTSDYSYTYSNFDTIVVAVDGEIKYA